MFYVVSRNFKSVFHTLNAALYCLREHRNAGDICWIENESGEWISRAQ